MKYWRRFEGWAWWQSRRIHHWMQGWDFNFAMRHRDRRNPTAAYKTYRAGPKWMSE